MDTTEEPVAYFITWTVYGTFLQGDARWWRKKRRGSQSPQPRLGRWHRERLKHDIILLNHEHRDIAKGEIEFNCKNRGWKLWIANPRSNHVHVVVSADGHSGDKFRDQLKANCTRGLRQFDNLFLERPVWTTKGDWQCINTDGDLHDVIEYAGTAQDQMEFK